MSSAKRAVFARLAEIAQGLAHPHRIELLEHLAQGTRTVEELAALTELTFANTSRHLKVLRQARLVIAQRRERNVFYNLSGEAEVVGLLGAIAIVGERNDAEIRHIVSDYFHSPDTLDAVTREELLSKLKDGTVIVLDVRPEDEFLLGHVPGARNMPIGQLSERLAELPKDREIVAYCRGPYCVFSFEAEAMLRREGFSVHRLEDGFPQWKAAGLPIESNRADESNRAGTRTA
ncbi:metalloregulator ArsR/SmtB family transcription factor [Rhizobium viscosum]|uniref:ArsR family transcriptional regulator n=1 Tax=Rhizobium viscosum TaxID=1673 RepID=A0ABR9IUJ4_RHIVS|nr:metalloregulator ArsR/SmtB family transcription factor [Rhizobium viscosum]MBE1506874.1 ArsR family transcriptional regulator [Rhizobium viscosum]